MGVRGLGFAIALSLALVFTMPHPAASLEGSGVMLQGLDKVTARVKTIEAELGQTVQFGSLEIVAKRCFKRPPEESPESAAFLEIREIRQGEDSRTLFSGWMFASSPALSALEHPVYDVWVKDCLNVKSADDSEPR